MLLNLNSINPPRSDDMTRLFAPHTHRILNRIGRSILIAGIVVSLGAPSIKQDAANAIDAHFQGMTNWQGSSFPVENFQTYTSPFGLRQAADGSYGQEYHRGLDMAAPEGSYIRNWWTGKVVEVSDNSACGTSVVVESGQWEHIYCHMKGYVETANGKRYVSDRDGGIQIFEGQLVLAGTRIGRVGMTGRTTGPHLHWGLKFAGQWVDPALVLKAMYAQQTGRNSVSAIPQ
jgi:murein DD-endopeptidase MepM/ murein hydrolase activator NlpD